MAILEGQNPRYRMVQDGIVVFDLPWTSAFWTKNLAQAISRLRHETNSLPWERLTGSRPIYAFGAFHAFEMVLLHFKVWHPTYHWLQRVRFSNAKSDIGNWFQDKNRHCSDHPCNHLGHLLPISYPYDLLGIPLRMATCHKWPQHGVCHRWHPNESGQVHTLRHMQLQLLGMCSCQLRETMTYVIRPQILQIWAIHIHKCRYFMDQTIEIL